MKTSSISCMNKKGGVGLKLTGCKVPYPVELFSPFFTVWHASQAGWDVPETNIGVLRLHTEIKTVKVGIFFKVH